jgi:hypothetical protein
MRRVKAVPLSRRNLQSFIDRRLCSEAEAWPTFLYRAWAIVAEELEQPDVARKTVISAVAAAHACAVAVSARVQANARSQARQEVSSAILSILNCVKRIRAPIRHALNEVAQVQFREGHADSEVMTNFFNGCADFVKGLPSEADVVRMVNALGVPVYEIEKLNRRIPATPTLKLIGDWESMHPSVRTAVELDLQKLVDDRSGNLTARDVLTTVAHSLAVESVTETREYSGDLLTAYVAEVAEIWRSSGLHPGRARRDGDGEYRSRFHVFLELVLLNQFDPRSRLFDKPSEEELKPGRKDYASLRASGEEVVMGPDYQWLTGDEDLKTALASDSKNST